MPLIEASLSPETTLLRQLLHIPHSSDMLNDHQRKTRQEHQAPKTPSGQRMAYFGRWICPMFFFSR